VQDLEDKLMRQSRDSMFINEMAAKDYITAVQLLAAIESDHEEVPTLLNRAAAMAKGLGQNKQAIRLYDWVIDEYQEQTEGKKALFYKGFTLDEEMEEYDRAEKAYTTFLEKYPDDQLASQVKILKSQLGKSDDEILEELKQKKANQ
jgi:tetratricopeptide (TPR) repeat protein